MIFQYDFYRYNDKYNVLYSLVRFTFKFSVTVKSKKVKLFKRCFVDNVTISSGLIPLISPSQSISSTCKTFSNVLGAVKTADVLSFNRK